MLKALVLAIVMLSTASAFADNKCSGKIDLTTQMSLFERLVYQLSELSGQKANPNEAKFFAHNLGVAFSMRGLVDLATKHSQIICGPRWIDKTRKLRDRNDNEVDAIRHFVLAALLGYEHPDQALQILFSHEIDGEHALNQQSLMDIHNNQLGIQFADTLKASKAKLSNDEVAFFAVEEALRLLKKRELKVLKGIDYGSCSSLEQKSEVELNALIIKHRQDYDLLQRACIGPAIDCGMK